MRSGGTAAAFAAALLLAGCGNGATSPRASVGESPIASPVELPSTTPSTPSLTPSASPTPSLAPLPADLRDVRLPAGVCHPDTPALQLRDGRAKAISRDAARTHGSADFYVNLGRDVRDVRADLTGDGTEDVAVVVSCDGYGGSNAWYLHVVVLTPGPNGLRLLGDLVPDDHGVGVGGIEVGVANGRLRTVDRTYRKDDPRCCATGYAWTEWRWDGTRFVQSGAGLGKA